MWSGIKAESVKHLPEGVDGLRVFKIPSESLKNEGKNIFKDGRTGKRIAQPNGKATVVSGMRTAKDLAMLQCTLSFHGGVQCCKYNTV